MFSGREVICFLQNLKHQPHSLLGFVAFLPNLFQCEIYPEDKLNCWESFEEKHLETDTEGTRLPPCDGHQVYKTISSTSRTTQCVVLRFTVDSARVRQKHETFSSELMETANCLKCILNSETFTQPAKALPSGI